MAKKSTAIDVTQGVIWQQPVSYTHLDVYKRQDVQCVADNAALELAKVKDSLSNAEVEDNMYASRLEQIDEQLEEVTASLDSRRDRAEELESALEAARQAQSDAREATETARAALKDLRAREGEARNKLSEVRSELASQKKLDARMADSSPLVSRLVGALGDDVSGLSLIHIYNRTAAHS